MQVREVMTPRAEVVDPNCTVKDLAQKMRNEDLGAIPICDGDKLLGMVTDRDIVTRGIATDKPLGNLSVREVMSEGVAFVHEEDDISIAQQKMSQHQVRRLPVVSKDNRLVGMISVADLTRTGQSAEAQSALDQITQPTDKSRKM